MFKKFLTAIVMLMLFCGHSWADIVYATHDGSLGSLEIKSSSDIGEPSIAYRSGISDPYLDAYWNGKDTDILMIEADKTSSGDRAYLFSPSDLSVMASSHDLVGIHGMNTASYSLNGRSLFMGAGSVLYEVSTENFGVVKSYDCRKVISRDGYETGLETVVVGYDTVNAIASAGDARRYVRFDGQLKERVTYFMSADVSADASCLTIQDNTVFLGHREGISGLNRTNKFVFVLSTDKPVEAFCNDDDRGFYYATRSGDVFTVSHSQNTAVSKKFEPVTILSDYPYIKMIRDRTHNTLAVMTAEEIALFDMKTGKFLRTYGTSELGGRPVGIAAASVYGYNNSSSSSSGCNLSGAGLILMTMLYAVMKRR